MSKKTSFSNRESARGQTLSEFLICLILLSLALVGTGGVFHAQWKRAQCAVMVFEKTHARLTGTTVPYPGMGGSIRIVETQERIRGDATCGSAHEEVSLPKLEYARW